MLFALVARWESVRQTLGTLCSLIVSICIASLGGCADNPQKHADALAQMAGLRREQVSTQGFLLSAYVRITRTDQPLTLYIEGDGQAWHNRYQASANPTPKRALGLTLAAADHSANVVYLARPCQFSAMADNPRCAAAYWTGKRFAPEVIAAMDEAITHYVGRTPGQRIHLVGYSGGAAIAVLVAARRQDVATLRTVAGNLDHDTVNRWHQVSLMPDSLNPIDVAARVANIAQIHFSGADDKIIPPIVGQNFVAKAGACARVQVVPGLSHEGGWAEIWPQLLMLRPPCMR